MNETVARNRGTGKVTLSIAIPTYRYDPARLINALRLCDHAENTHLIVYDDGSDSPELTHANKAHIDAWPGPATLVSGAENGGRSYARNRLLAHADTNWILFIDADMIPDQTDFLTRYLNAIEETSEPAIISGGYSLFLASPSKAQKLHAVQSIKSECLSAAARAKSPGRYVFTSNILVHRDVMTAIKFDDAFTGWGWEDTDWGLRVAKAFPVRHIENTATHLGLDDTTTLLKKYGGSGENFARMLARHPDATKTMALTKVARRLAGLPGRSLIRSVSKATVRSPLPASLRLRALKLYRAAVYAEFLK